MSDSTIICPVCDKGTLTKEAYSDEFKHGRHTVTVDGLEGYLCDACDSEPISPQQIRRNQRKIADAKRRWRLVPLK